MHLIIAALICSLFPILNALVQNVVIFLLIFDLVFSFVSLSMDLPHQTTVYKAEDAIFLQNKVDHGMFLSQILHYLPFAYDPLHESPFK